MTFPAASSGMLEGGWKSESLQSLRDVSMPSRTAEPSLPGVGERCKNIDLGGKLRGQRTAA